MKSCPDLLSHLKSLGVEIENESPSLFGYALKGYYPLGERRVHFFYLFGSLSKRATLQMDFPIYKNGDQEMIDAYDSFFPKEKNAWGRSTPSFRQAIKDYMRGQELCPVASRNYIGINDDQGIVEIRLVASSRSMGEKGMIEAFKKLRYELEQGQLHRDVLSHLFAF